MPKHKDKRDTSVDWERDNFGTQQLHLSAPVESIAWSPDGTSIAVACSDLRIRIIQPPSADAVFSLKASSRVLDIAWSPNGRRLAALVARRNTAWSRIIVWDVTTKKVVLQIADASLSAFAWVPNGRELAIADAGHVVLRRCSDGKLVKSIPLPAASRGVSKSLKWASSGRYLALVDEDSAHVLHFGIGNRWSPFGVRNGSIRDTSWSKDGNTIALATSEGEVHIWDVEHARFLAVVEALTDELYAVSFSPDGRYLSSLGRKGTITLNDASTWEFLAELTGAAPALHGNPRTMAFHPKRGMLAAARDDDGLQLWNLDSLGFPDDAPATVRYATAKLVLVGDHGAGKTAIGWRIACAEFKETSSTHGQQFWLVGELGETPVDGVEREAILWDFAGQPDYRIVHALELDDVDVAILVFDASNRKDPLSGVEYWMHQLQLSNRPWRAILVGAQMDRGSPSVMEDELLTLCTRLGISGGYVATSARTNEGIEALVAAIGGQIPWDDIPPLVTTELYKRIKEFVLDLKQVGISNDGAHRLVLLSAAQLRFELERARPEMIVTDEEMMTAVHYLQKHGYVRLLLGSRGDTSILLAPELVPSLASSYVLEARRNRLGLGVLEEERLSRGEYLFPELSGLSDRERVVLIDATTARFVERNLCFRETLDQTSVLIFPALINEKRPPLDERDVEEDVSYYVTGAVEHVYAVLVVLLGYTTLFRRTNQWQNQAEYELKPGEICGFRVTEEREGELEFALYYGLQTPKNVKLIFQGLFERFLELRELAVVQCPPVVCFSCRYVLKHDVVMSQLRRGLRHVFCNDCGAKLALPELRSLSGTQSPIDGELRAQQKAVARRTVFEAGLTRVKRLLSDRGSANPSCFISYAWGSNEANSWVTRFAKDLGEAGIVVFLDQWDSLPGSSLSRYIDRVEAVNYVLLVGTPALKRKYASENRDSVVSAELAIINTRIRMRNEYGDRVIPILRRGDRRAAFPPQLQDIVSVDFRKDDDYFGKLLGVIWTIHELPIKEPLYDELRESLCSASDVRRPRRKRLAARQL